MIQNKDYILQMIEAAGKALAKIIGFREQEEFHQALEELELCYAKHFDLIHIETESNYLKLDMYGELLKHEADINTKLGKHIKAKELYLKALQSLTKAEVESKTFDMKRIGLMGDIRSSIR
jgi:tetratricopeptide (TPR) repeat protein